MISTLSWFLFHLTTRPKPYLPLHQTLLSQSKLPTFPHLNSYPLSITSSPRHLLSRRRRRRRRRHRIRSLSTHTSPNQHSRNLTQADRIFESSSSTPENHEPFPPSTNYPDCMTIYRMTYLCLLMLLLFFLFLSLFPLPLLLLRESTRLPWGIYRVILQINIKVTTHFMVVMMGIIHDKVRVRVISIVG